MGGFCPLRSLGQVYPDQYGPGAPVRCERDGHRPNRQSPVGLLGEQGIGTERLGLGIMASFIKGAAAALSASIVAMAGFGAAMAQSNALGAQTNALGGPTVRVTEPSEVLGSLHAAALIPVLDELNVSYKGASLPSGEKIILAVSEGGLRFQLTPSACDARGESCKGLHMLALFQSKAPSRTVAAFNYRYAFVSTGIDDSGVAYISRYEIADYGMPKGNLAVAIGNYLHMASMFDRHLFEATNTVSNEATDTDFAANGLNMRSVLADHRLARQVGLSPNAHNVSLEAISGFVDTYVRADALNPGRIINPVNGTR